MENRTDDIWRRVHDGLRGFIGKRVGDEAETDDILQEVFVRVQRHIDQLKEPERLVPWVFQITRRVIGDYYRAPGRRRERPVGLAGDLEAEAMEPSVESGSNATAELSRCLRPMLDRLSDEYRQAIILVELEGLTHRQAASRVGLSVPGMKSRVQRGRRQLRKLLEECCVIELDCRNGVMGYERRRPDAPSC